MPFSQFIGKSGPDKLFCALCPGDVELIYIQRTREYKCPKCGEVLDDRTRFTRRKTKLIAPNSLEHSSIHLSQVTAGEFQSRNSIEKIRNETYHSPREAWEAD